MKTPNQVAAANSEGVREPAGSDGVGLLDVQRRVALVFIPARSGDCEANFLTAGPHPHNRGGPALGGHCVAAGSNGE